MIRLSGLKETPHNTPAACGEFCQSSGRYRRKCGCFFRAHGKSKNGPLHSGAKSLLAYRPKAMVWANSSFLSKAVGNSAQHALALKREACSWCQMLLTGRRRSGLRHVSFFPEIPGDNRLVKRRNDFYQVSFFNPFAVKEEPMGATGVAIIWVVE